MSPIVAQSKLCRSCSVIRLNSGRLAQAAYNWQGGQIKRNGYIFIRRPEHPNAIMGGYVKRARLILEHEMGGYIDEALQIHHINKVKDDDQLENLQLLSRSEHRRLHTKHRDNKGRFVGKVKC